MESTFEEGLLAEVQVDLTGNVELRMLETPSVVHILTSRGRPVMTSHRTSLRKIKTVWCHSPMQYFLHDLRKLHLKAGYLIIIIISSTHLSQKINGTWSKRPIPSTGRAVYIRL